MTSVSSAVFCRDSQGCLIKVRRYRTNSNGCTVGDLSRNSTVLMMFWQKIQSQHIFNTKILLRHIVICMTSDSATSGGRIVCITIKISSKCTSNSEHYYRSCWTYPISAFRHHWCPFHFFFFNILYFYFSFSATFSNGKCHYMVFLL